MSKPTVIDLFCGAGGLALGLRRAGFQLRCSVDSDPWAVKTYRTNLGNHVVQAGIDTMAVKDLLDLARLEPGECDLLAGGPPCQGFSVQRRGNDHDPRNELVLHFVRMVEGIRPKFFLMENVSGLTSKRGHAVLSELMERTERSGYEVHLRKLDAIDYGVPQFRIRTILVGERIDRGCARARFDYPAPTTPEADRRTVMDAIGDLPRPPADGTSHPRFANHAREARLSSTNLERIRHIPPGGGREHLPLRLQLPCHRKNPTHRHVEVYGRLAWEKPSGTITARFDSFTRGRFGHPEDDRSLTIREGARLQTFPDDFVFLGNREECAKQVGNAVPPILAEMLGRAILKCIHSQARRMPKRAKAGVRLAANQGLGP
jgi:DNA (cytosine-5)-methyltransferase 1